MSIFQRHLCRTMTAATAPVSRGTSLFYSRAISGGIAVVVFAAGTAHAAGNLIPNGSLETASGSVPSGWVTSTYGSPAATFTYPATGNAGTKGASVTLSANSSGDGNWQLASPVAVTAGTTYTFSDWYSSTAATEIDAAYTSSSGAVSYAWLADVPSSGGVWKQVSVSFTVPSGMTKITPFHLIANKGTLTIDDVSLASAGGATTTPAPVLTFSASPASITAGQSSTLTWSSTNATSCTASGGWSGSKAVSGTQSVSPTATTTYTLACTGAGGSATSSASVAVAPAPPASGNLIVNGSLEAGTTNTPTSWTKDTWGSLTATFSYPVTGNGGTKAAQVTVSNYKNGAASWDPAAVSVTPGTLYTLSDYYKATVDSEIDVMYRVAAAHSIAGECSADSDPAYVDCYEVVARSVPASSAGFTKFVATIAPPAGTVSMIVQHLLAKNGTLAIDDMSVTPGVAAADKYAKGVVSLTFDDGYTDLFTNAYPILQNANMRGTFYMIPSVMNSNPATYMTPAQMLQMQTAGHDMASHTVDHCDLAVLSGNPNAAKTTTGCPDGPLSAATTSQAEVVNAKVELAAMGATPVDSIAYPYGSYNGTVEQQVKAAGYKAARGTDQGYNTKATVAADPYRLVVQNMYNTTTLATVQSWVDTALANNAWLILVFHQIDASNPSNDAYYVTPTTLQGITSYLSQKGACVQTVSQVVNGVACQ